MKGKLLKDHEGWWVQHKVEGLDGIEYIAESMLHPDDIKQIEEDAKVFDSIEARIAAYPDVEFKMVTEVVASIGDSEEQDEYTISYAKLINHISDTVNDTVSELDKLAEKTFKGDDATTFVQREIWKDGYKKAKETLYTKEDVLKAGQIGEINHFDYNHIVSLLDEVKVINKSLKLTKK